MTVNVIRRRTTIAALIILVLAGAATWRFMPRTTPEEYVRRGFAAIDQNDWPALLRCAERLKAHPQFRLEASLFRGVYLLKTGQPSAALAELGTLDPTGDVREPALLAAGEALYRQQQLAEAGRMFAALTAEQPGHTEAHRWLAAVAYDLGDFNRAMDECEIVIRQSPRDYRPHLLKGQMLFDLERFTDAAASYSHAVNLNPPESVLEEALPALARSYIADRDYRPAMETLNRAPRSALVLALQAECRMSLGDQSGARRLLDEARDIDPEQPDMLRLLGRMELEAGHFEAAVSALEAVLEQDPQDQASRHQLVQALRSSGRTAEAEAEARKTARTIALKTELSQLTLDAIDQPGNSDVRERMARICDELGKPDLAAMWRTAAAACRKAPAPGSGP